VKRTRRPASRRGFLGTTLTILIILGAGRARAAVPYNVGDVFAAIGNGQVKHFDPTGTLLETLDDTTGSQFTAGMCFDGSGNLYVTNFSTGNVSKFDNAGNLVNASFLTGLSNPESCSRDVAGDIYVGQAGANTIMKFSSSGALLNTYTVATESRGTDWIDLASDQCTMFYTSEGNLIKRFDVCANTQLADFATISGPTYAFRILGNGGVLAAATSQIFQLDSSGAIVGTYTAAGKSLFFALNRDPNGTQFWSGGLFTGLIYKFNINPTGQPPVTTFNSNFNTALGGVAVFGELTQGQPTPTPGGGPTPTPGTQAVVPTLSFPMMLVLGLALVWAAVFVLLRR
jgi:hypothetical protein